MGNFISIPVKEYKELIAAQNTLILVFNLMNKEMEAKEAVSTFIDGEKYMDIMNCFFDVMEVENAGQTEDF